MQTLIEPNIHPMFVHFAYALSITSVVCYLLSGLWATRRDSLRAAADWMLAFGALAIMATIAAGFQAYYSVGHDTPSHAAMTTHRNWAVPSGSAIFLLAIWRWIDRAKPVKLLFKSLLTLAALSLSVTAWWGGHIVYNYGLGVKSLPVVTGDGHDHEHGSGAAIADDAKTAGHDNADGHDDTVETPAPVGHDNSDGHHGDVATAVPAGHDNSDGHHDQDAQSADDTAIKSIITAIQKGWEDGDGTPFRSHFLDYEGARYFESGGQNSGLSDLVENHVEPEKDSIPDLKLSLSDLAIHYENDFAWATASTTVQGTVVSSGRVLDRTGKQTWLFRKIGGEWKIVHTHSSSRAKRK
jgi:uncharacterized membrane protein